MASNPEKNQLKKSTEQEELDAWRAEVEANPDSEVAKRFAQMRQDIENAGRDMVPKKGTETKSEDAK